MRRQYSDDDIKNAVSKSASMATVLKLLGLVPLGGNYKTLKRNITRLQLDTSHFTGKGHLRGKTHTWAKKIPLDEIMVVDSTYSCISKLRERLIKTGIFKAKCYRCENTEWMDNPIPLELEHKNGNNTDNRIENLTILCPNCHALTSTYRGRNKKSRIQSEEVEQVGVEPTR